MLLPLGRACLPLQKQSKTKSPLVVKSHSHNPRMLRSLAGGLARRARHLRALSCSPATKLRSAGEVGGWWGAGVDTPSPFTLVSLQELVLHLYGASGFSETFHLGWLNGWGRRESRLSGSMTRYKSGPGPPPGNLKRRILLKSQVKDPSLHSSSFRSLQWH